MELNEFVQKTIEQVLSGVRQAHDHARSIKADVGSSNFSAIEFDVAVTATNENSAKGGGGIKVWGIGANAEGGSVSTNSTVSRVKFSVQVRLPSTVAPPGMAYAPSRTTRVPQSTG